MKLTLVRHAEVEELYLGKYNGHIDIDLSKKGEEEALMIAQKLKNIPFDALYCSDLQRAKKTLAPLLQHTSIKPNYTPKLREKSWGKYEGMSFEEIAAQDIEYTNFTGWVDALGGESLRDFHTRIEQFFFTELAQTNHTDVLVVTHSGVIKTFLQIQNRLSLQEAFSLQIPYASITQTEL